MPKFMVIVPGNAESEAGDLPPHDVLDAMTAYNEELAKAGMILDLNGLRPTSDGAKVRFDGVDDVIRTLILDPQTSGGLLVGVPTAHAEAWERASAASGVMPTQIGEVLAGDAGVQVVR